MENRCTAGKPENSVFALEDKDFVPSDLVDLKDKVVNTSTTSIQVSRVVSTTCCREAPWLKYVPRDKDVVSTNESTKD